MPAGLGPLGVLAEPASICARGIRHAEAIAGRQPWAPRRALVLGTGAIGMLATYLLRLRGFDVWTAGRSAATEQRAQLAAASGATYFSTADVPLADAAADVGGFDLVLEATGDAQVMLETVALLGRNGVACLLGIDGRPRDVTRRRARAGRRRDPAEPRAVRQRQRPSRGLGDRRRRPRRGASPVAGRGRRRSSA